MKRAADGEAPDAYEAAARWLCTASSPLDEDGRVPDHLAEAAREQDVLPHGTSVALDGGALRVLAETSAADLRRFPMHVVTAGGRVVRALPMQLGTVRLVVDEVPRWVRVTVESRSRGSSVAELSTKHLGPKKCKATVVCAPCGTGKSSVAKLAAAHILLAQRADYLESLPDWAAGTFLGAMSDVCAVAEAPPCNAAVFVVPAHLVEQWRRTLWLDVTAVLRKHYACPELRVTRTVPESGPPALTVMSYEEFDRAPARAYPVVVFDEVTDEAGLCREPPLMWRCICLAPGAAALNSALAAAPPESMFRRLLRTGRDEAQALASLITRDVLRGLRHLVLRAAAERMPGALERHTVSVSVVRAGEPLGAGELLGTVDAGAAGAVERLRQLVPHVSDRLEASVQQIGGSKFCCPVCLEEEVSEAWINVACQHGCCTHCKDAMDSTGRQACPVCRAPLSAGVLVAKKDGARLTLPKRLRQLEDRRHPHMVYAAAEVAVALVHSGHRRMVAFGLELSAPASLITLRDLLLRSRPAVQLIAPHEENKVARPGEEDVAAFLVDEDRGPKLLVLPGTDARALAGTDLAGADAIITTVGRRATRHDELLARVFRMSNRERRCLRHVTLVAKDTL